MGELKKAPLIAASCFILLLLYGWSYIGGSSKDNMGEGLTAAVRGRLADVALQEYEKNGGVRGSGREYWSYWGKPPEPWCADFVYYCADQIGLVGTDKLLGPYTAGCSQAWAQLKAQGAHLFAVGADTPRPGDLVFWYTTGGGCASLLDDYSRLSHIGIVIAYSEEENTLTTVEGNTGGLGSANNYVSMKTYSDLYGQSWSGAAFFGFARIKSAADSLTGFVKAFEGFSKHPFWDYSQYSVGYGTACPADRLEEYRIYGIPEQEAIALLEQALLSSANAVERYCSDTLLSLSVPQRDALISLTYNIGESWMTDSTYSGLRSVIAAPTDGLAVTQAFANISHAGGRILPGLVERRICEAWLFLHGEYVTDYTATDYQYTISEDHVLIFGRDAP